MKNGLPHEIGGTYGAIFIESDMLSLTVPRINVRKYFLVFCIALNLRKIAVFDVLLQDGMKKNKKKLKKVLTS